MSDLHQFILRPDYRASLIAMFPQVTAAQLMRFDDLVRSDRIIADDGEPHPDLMAWVAAVMRRGDEGQHLPANPAPQGPSPTLAVTAEVRA